MKALLATCAAALIALISPLPTSASPANDWRFALTTPSGRDVTMESYRGKWLLVYFGYTFCPDVCPATLTELGEALKALGSRAEHVKALFITLDPVRDKAPVMARYLKAFDPRIEGLRGDAEEIENAAKSFHVYYRPRSVGHGEYAIDHSSYVHVFDPQGHFVRLLAPNAPGHKIAEDLKRLIR
jgi:protein SCO1/2